MSHTLETAPVRVTSHSFIVAYADTDQMGVVYHSNYLRWFEIGRTDMLRSLGHQYRDWEETRGIFLPVLSASLEFHRPARYDDWIAVQAALTRMTPAGVEFQYRVMRVDGQRSLEAGTLPVAEALASGATRHAFVDREGRIRRVAKELLPEVFGLYRVPVGAPGEQ